MAKRVVGAWVLSIWLGLWAATVTETEGLVAAMERKTGRLGGDVDEVVSDTEMGIVVAIRDQLPHLLRIYYRSGSLLTSRPVAAAIPRKAPPDRKSNDRVIKRPARGYHTFKNGALNVTPKGTEKDIVKSNQDSPLLRLPAEIRNTIWKYTLGGKTMRPVYSYRSRLNFVPKPSERINTFALLRTCRQIYAEGALIPYTESIFSVEYMADVTRAFRRFRKHQLGHIRELSIECDRYVPNHFDVHQFISGIMFFLPSKALPNLRRLRLGFFSSDDWNAVTFEETEKAIRSALFKSLVNRQIRASTRENGYQHL
ncbi:hypothetical protein DE146DRAFT_629203 [Phaeosphaeria sp. MPI-PUGE-AT-0046c]|nr:hypothetical protein DE146DRAFT_629203 [Phaeosphaeria sp. MPI-PUGE-AT-0046c]